MDVARLPRHGVVASRQVEVALPAGDDVAVSAEFGVLVEEVLGSGIRHARTAMVRLPAAVLGGLTMWLQRGSSSAAG